MHKLTPHLLSREPTFYQQSDLSYRSSSTAEIPENLAQNQFSHHVFISADALRHGRDRTESIFERNNRAATDARPAPQERRQTHSHSRVSVAHPNDNVASGHQAQTHVFQERKDVATRKISGNHSGWIVQSTRSLTIRVVRTPAKAMTTYGP